MEIFLSGFLYFINSKLIYEYPYFFLWYKDLLFQLKAFKMDMQECQFLSGYLIKGYSFKKFNICFNKIGEYCDKSFNKWGLKYYSLNIIYDNDFWHTTENSISYQSIYNNKLQP